MCQKEANSSQWQHQWVLVSHQLKRRSWKIWQLTNKNTHRLIYTKGLCKSHAFWGWWLCQSYDGEESQYQAWKVCSLSHVCLYSPPARWTLFKLNPHITLPQWDFMQDRIRNLEVTPNSATFSAQELSLRVRWAHPMHNARDIGILPFI